MTAKEYLGQARFLDMRINSKIQQIASLNELATRCTATISDMPKSPNRGGSRMADAVIKIIDLQEEINRDINKLVELKREIMGVIKAVPNVEYQTVLEKRYLCFITWEQIAVDMNYSMQYTFRIHEKALKEIEAYLQSGE
jgi:DNA-directed RNA polymerase specialized sigma subunit